MLQHLPRGLAHRVGELFIDFCDPYKGGDMSDAPHRRRPDSKDVLSAPGTVPSGVDLCREDVRREEGPDQRAHRPDDRGLTRSPRGARDPWLAAMAHALECGPADPDQPDREARDVLARVLTPAAVDKWFELPNYLLNGRTPRDVLADDPRAVLGAAWELAFGEG